MVTTHKDHLRWTTDKSECSWCADIADLEADRASLQYSLDRAFQDLEKAEAEVERLKLAHYYWHGSCDCQEPWGRAP